MIDANMTMHFPDLTVLNSCNRHDSVTPQDIEVGAVTAVIQQLSLGLGIERVRQRLSQQGLDIPPRVHDGAVPDAATDQGTHGHGGGEERLVGVVLCAGDLAGEGRLVEKGEDGIDYFKVEVDEVDDGGLADNVRRAPGGRRLAGRGIGGGAEGLLHLRDDAQVALGRRSRQLHVGQALGAAARSTSAASGGDASAARRAVIRARLGKVAAVLAAGAVVGRAAADAPAVAVVAGPRDAALLGLGAGAGDGAGDAAKARVGRHDSAGDATLRIRVRRSLNGPETHVPSCTRDLVHSDSVRLLSWAGCLGGDKALRQTTAAVQIQVRGFCSFHCEGVAAQQRRL